MRNPDPNLRARDDKNNTMYMILGFILIVVIAVLALAALSGGNPTDSSLVTASPVDQIVPTVQSEEPTLEATVADAGTEATVALDDMDMTMTATEDTGGG